MSETTESPSKITETSRSADNRSGLIVLGLLLLAAYIAFSMFGDDNSSRPAASLATPSGYDVTYRVTTGRALVDLTYSNEGENTEQLDNIRTPWSLSFRADRGQHLYVSAQSQWDRSDTVACEIAVNGVVVESAESTGRFVIASCSGIAR